MTDLTDLPDFPSDMFSEFDPPEAKQPEDSNYATVRRTSTWKSTPSLYSSIVDDHDGEFDLSTDIEAKDVSTMDLHGVIRIRKLHNDSLFPFDARTFIQWFETNPTDPHTREDLSYLRNRVGFKKKCLATFPDKKIDQLDEHYRKNLTTHTLEILRKKVVGTPLDDAEKLVLLEGRSFVDIASLEESGYVWTTLGYHQTTATLQNKPVRSWILRKSSRHDNLMPNAEIIVIAFKCSHGTKQRRCVFVHGVGWYVCDGNVPLGSFRALGSHFYTGQGSGIAPPHYLTIIDLLDDYLCAKKMIDLDKCVKAHSE
jgi:hypothetical protein